jgi:hypothetical protein
MIRRLSLKAIVVLFMAMSLASNQARTLHIFTCLFPASLDAPALLDSFGAVGERFDAA